MHKIKLLDFVDQPITMGSKNGVLAYLRISNMLDKMPNEKIFEISFDGIVAVDAVFIRESIIALAKNNGSKKAFILKDIFDRDVLDNCSYAAISKKQPVLIYFNYEPDWVGLAINNQMKLLLEHIQTLNEFKTSDISKHFNLSMTYASMQLKKLSDQGFILSRKEKQESGGYQYLFNSIKTKR